MFEVALLATLAFSRIVTEANLGSGGGHRGALGLVLFALAGALVPLLATGFALWTLVSTRVPLVTLLMSFTWGILAAN